MAGASIQIAILANAAKARQEINSTTSAAQKMGDKIRGLRAPALLGLGALAAGAKGAIDSASDLNEEISKSQQIFGKQASAVEKFADTASTSLGQSKQQALDATSTFGMMAQNAGLGGKAAVDFSKQFTTLASDIASFNNATPQEAIDAIGAAMRGEAEPIRRFGVMLDDTTLRNQALKMGLIDSVKTALTPQQKALAASSAIMAQTTKAQGDFARTSGGAANKQRILAAQTEDLKAKLGQALLPTYAKLQQALLKIIGFLSKHKDVVQKVVAVVAGLAVGVLALNVAMTVGGAVTKAYTAVTTLFSLAQKAATAASLGTRLGLVALAAQTVITSAVTKAAAAAQWLLNAAMSANPITLVILAIVALVAVFVVAWKKSETFRAIVIGTWNAIKAASVAVFNFLKGFIKGVWSVIKTVFTTYFNIYKAIVTTVWKVIKSVVTTSVNAVKSVITTVWNAIRTATDKVWSGIKTAVSTAIGFVVDKVRGIKDKVTGLFSGAGTWLLDAGKKIIQGLIDGVEALIGKFKDKLKSLTDLIPDLKGPPKKDAKLLRPAGELIIQGLIDGFDRALPGVRKTLTGVTREIAGFSSGMNAELTLTGPHGSISRNEAQVGNTYEITVNAPVGSSSADIGRDLVKHIDAYERAGGRRAA